MNAIEEGNANFDELAKKTESLTKAREGSMKEAAEQHSVLSCDSCEHAEKTNSRDYPVKCMVSKPVPMMVHNYCISWFGYVGCASHSAEPAPMVHKDCDNCHVYLQVKEARKQERERVLDLLITFRKAQSRVYPLKVSWEEEGKYILELRGGEP